MKFNILNRHFSTKIFHFKLGGEWYFRLFNFACGNRKDTNKYYTTFNYTNGPYAFNLYYEKTLVRSIIKAFKAKYL